MIKRAFREGTRPMAVAPGTGVFEGHASLFGRLDQAGDMVMPGAFAASLAAKGAGGIRMLFQHDPKEVVGAWLEMREDARGLFVRGRINARVQRGRELIALIDQRAIDGLSIGFRTVSAGRDKGSGARKLYRIDLWEVSLVAFPMLEGARVSRARARAEAHFIMDHQQGA
jgi:uncharacterized protein